jgi:hypothetical protein
MKTPNYDDEPAAPLVVATTCIAPYESSYSDTAPYRASQWTCPQCTLINPEHIQCCEACNFSKKMLKPPPPSSTERTQPDRALVPVNTYFENNHGNNNGDEYGDNQDDIPVQEFPGEDPLAKKKRRCFRRRVRIAVSATAGIIVGAVIFVGPWGAIVGGIAGGAGARVLSKRGERKKDTRVAQTRLTQAIVS